MPCRGEQSASVSDLLLVDIGNTTTRLGRRRDRRLQVLSVAGTREASTLREVAALAESVLGPPEAPAGELALAMCSVVPAAGEVWLEWCAARGVTPLTVRGDTPTPLTNQYRAPDLLGGDRIAAAVGAAQRLGTPVVVASLGTATVVDAVSAEGGFLGGAIAAGVETGLTALAEHTRALPRVTAAEVSSPIGRDTTESLRVGAVCGTASLVAGLTEQMRGVIGAEAPLALTGGYAELIAGHLGLDCTVAPELTLEGLAAIWDYNQGETG